LSPGLWETGLWETPPCGPPAGAALARLALRLDFGSQFPLCGLDPHQRPNTQARFVCIYETGGRPRLLKGKAQARGRRWPRVRCNHFSHKWKEDATTTTLDYTCMFFRCCARTVDRGYLPESAQSLEARSECSTSREREAWTKHLATCWLFRGCASASTILRLGLLRPGRVRIV
jgi:hypothetical protein